MEVWSSRTAFTTSGASILKVFILFYYFFWTVNLNLNHISNQLVNVGSVFCAYWIPKTGQEV